MHGDGKLAKTLSRNGRQHDEAMRALHNEAAAAIFAARKAEGSRADVLDLHGLHVEEALSYLEWWLETLLDDAKFKIGYVIVGTGHHSKHLHLGKLSNQVIAKINVRVASVLILTFLIGPSSTGC